MPKGRLNGRFMSMLVRDVSGTRTPALSISFPLFNAAVKSLVCCQFGIPFKRIDALIFQKKWSRNI